MPDGILDQGLEHEARDQSIHRVGIRLDGRGEPLAETELFQFQVAPDEVEFLRYRNFLSLVEQQCPQQIAQPRHRAHRCLGITGADQRRDGVQRVEQEVRVHPRLQRFHPRGEQTRFQLARMEPLRRRQAVIGKSVAERDQRRVREEIDEQLAGDLRGEVRSDSRHVERTADPVRRWRADQNGRQRRADVHSRVPWPGAAIERISLGKPQDCRREQRPDPAADQTFQRAT